MAPSDEIDVFFIVDGDKLVAQAHLLVCSILEHMHGRCNFIAYSRADATHLVPDSLKRLFDRAGIATRTIPGTEPGVPDPWRRRYPIGNKLLAAADERPGRLSVFIDTDVVFCAPVDFAAELGNGIVGAVLSDYRTGFLPDDRAWQGVYDFFGQSSPDDRPGTLRRPNLSYPPYFNAGVVVLQNRVHGYDHSVGRRWLDMGLEYDRGSGVPKTPANLDQITLSLLGGSFGDPTRTLPHALNYNIAGWGDAVPEKCRIAHYHRIGKIWQARLVGRQLLASVRRFMPQSDIDDFRKTYGAHLRWRRAAQMLEGASG